MSITSKNPGIELMEMTALARLLYHADHRKVDPHSRQLAERVVTRLARKHGYSDWLDVAYNCTGPLPLERTEAGAPDSDS